MKGVMRFTQAPPFRYKVKGGAAVVACYARLHLAHDVGVIRGFYCGTRSDDDDSIIWQVETLAGETLEYERAEHARVTALLDELERAAGVSSIERGPQWCGYRGVILRLVDGRTIETRWASGRGVVELVDGIEQPRELVAVAS